MFFTDNKLLRQTTTLRQKSNNMNAKSGKYTVLEGFLSIYGNEINLYKKVE